MENSFSASDGVTETFCKVFAVYGYQIGISFMPQLRESDKKSPQTRLADQISQKKDSQSFHLSVLLLPKKRRLV